MVGSCVRFRSGMRTGVFSALHVACECLFRGAMGVVAPDFTQLHAAGDWAFSNSCRYWMNDRIDAFAYVAAPDVPAHEGGEGEGNRVPIEVCLPECSCDNRPSILMHGFPGALQPQLGAEQDVGEKQLVPISFGTHALSNEECRQLGVDPARFVVFPYSMEPGAVETATGPGQAADPHGFSGCGVWLMPDREGDELRLIAITSRWHDDGKHIVATKVHFHLQLLEEILGDRRRESFQWECLACQSLSEALLLPLGDSIPVDAVSRPCHTCRARTGHRAVGAPERRLTPRE